VQTLADYYLKFLSSCPSSNFPADGMGNIPKQIMPLSDNDYIDISQDVLGTKLNAI